MAQLCGIKYKTLLLSCRGEGRSKRCWDQLCINTLCHWKSYTPKESSNRLMAENGLPHREFADISYLVMNFKSALLRDVCTLCSRM